MRRMMRVIIIIIIIIGCSACDDIYTAGNLVSLDYPINTKLSFRIINRYLDTLTLKGGFGVPPKWTTRKKLEDLDSVNNRRVYFSKNPEEMYELSFNGQLILLDVFNENINKTDWVSDRKKMNELNKNRVITRMNFLLDTIEIMAEKDHLPDSLIYFSKKW